MKLAISLRSILLTAALCVLVGAGGLLFLYRQGSISEQSTPIHMEKTMNAANLQSFKLLSDTPDVTFVRSESGQLRVSLDGTVNAGSEDNLRFELTSGDNGVSAEAEIRTAKSFTIGIDLNQLLELFHNKLQVTVELPEQAYRSLKVDTDTGDVTLKDVRAETLELKSDTGELTLDGYTGARLTGTTDTGTMRLSRVNAGLNLNSDTGDFHLSLESLVGDVMLSTDTGDMDVVLEQAAPLAVDFASDTGRTTAEAAGGSSFQLESKEKHRLSGTLNGGGPLIKARSDTGDIRLEVR